MNSQRRRRRLPAAAASLPLVLGGALLFSPPAGASDARATVETADRAPVEASDAARQPTYDVTLVTGDVVHYTDRPGPHDNITVDRPAGARGGVDVQTYGDNTYVIPTEAMGLIAADKLDRELFDVTRLVAMGYDDARSGGIPVIATAPRSRGAQRPATPKGAAEVRELPSIGAVALKTDADHARTFWKDITPSGAAAQQTRSLDSGSGIGKVWLDGKVEAALAESVPQVRAPEAWAEGFDGTGSKVAVLDTGVDDTHPDLKGAIAAQKSFVPGQSTDDTAGHGTHVASTIAGSGAASDGVKKGVAPGARLYIGKVLSNEGSGTESGIVAGMEWAREQGVDVVSMSLGTNTASDGSDPVSQAVNTLSADGGPLFVVAAGNNMYEGTVGSPGAAASALTVSAVDKHDNRAAFSSQGPIPRTYAVKPDISAPGVAISAATAHPAAGSSMYTSMSGTSMATPHVAGAAAIVRQAHPDWDAARVKDALMTNSRKLNAYTPYQLGSGRLDVAAAVDGAIEAPGSVASAVFRWPNKDAAPVERTLTYRNSGRAEVTLDLSTGTTSPDHTLSASSLTLPAGGKGEVTLRLDGTSLTATKAYSGQVTATDHASGKVVAHTSYALFKEPELYDYTLKLTGRDGKPVTGTVALTFPGNAVPGMVTVYGSTTLRLPPRTYTAWGFLDVAGRSDDELGLAMVIAPDVVVGEGGATANLDASAARLVRSVTPRETERTQAVVHYRRTSSGGGGASSAFVMDPAYDALYVQPTDEADKGAQDLLVHWQLRQKALDAVTGTGHDIALNAQAGSAFQDGRRRLRTVYAGRGTAADYTGLDVKGRAVLVERGGAGPDERAQAAADAGAAVLITVNDDRGRLYETFGDAHGLTLASVGTADGARLVAEATSGTGTLNLTQRRYPDYQYDLVQYQKGAVPDHDLVYRPTTDELARVDTRFYAPMSGAGTTEGLGHRILAPYWGQGVGSNTKEGYPASRTDYLSPVPAGTGKWYEDHRFTLRTNASDPVKASDSVYETAPAQVFAAGRRYAGDWFKPVVGPRLGEGVWRPSRTSNSMSWNFPAWSGSGVGHTAISPNGRDGTVGVELRRGDALLSRSEGYAGWSGGLTGDEQPYSLTLDASRADTGHWAKSTSTHTTWTFRSSAPPQGTPSKEIPLLDLSYDVDTDLRGDVPAGRQVNIGLSGASYTGGAVATHATLQVSYDGGETWHPVSLDRTGDGRWSARVTTPRTADASVSLRASAEGPNGLSVAQDVIGAFGLK